ncbi:MAG: DnaJ domain-containing protein, partial [Clostridia bacterium]|nr:DnaJ domain-containing protein [Clostridia bacterium]
MKNYYEVLGVGVNADLKQIKSAYLSLLKKYHPDIYEGDKEFAQQKTVEINEAYNTLCDEQKKLD